jgi:hypothetical protein
MTPCRAACLALVSVSLWAAPVLAQMRSAPIPDNAKVGVIRHVEGMAVTVSKKPMQLAAGATIRNQRNLIIVPVAIPGEGAWAAFTLDREGQISQVWLLTPEELAAARKRLSGAKS